jgi:hypothetical protein
MTRARPLRFLALVLFAWVGARAVILNMPAPRVAQASAAASPPIPQATTASAATPALPALPEPAALTIAYSVIRELPYKGRRTSALSPMVASRMASVLVDWAASTAAARPNEAPAQALARPAPLGLPRPGADTTIRPRRWSGSAWLLVRDERGAAALAPGGTLGGSQAGARLSYRIDGGLALSGRFYLPLRRTGEAEVAAGIDWRPSARLPVHLLAERRQDVGGEGRSAFALTLYGGASGRLPGGLWAEAYGQAGVVGVRSRDPFVDGSVRVALPAGPVEIGGGAWGAAQPGAARLDAGPSVSYRLPVRRANLRLQADWRFRIAGDAAPGSGPALTLAADF